MIVRSLQESERTERHIVGEGWESTRLLLREDGMGFSFSVTTLNAGRESPPRGYQHHFEAVFVLEGEGEVECLDDGKVYPISAGTFYALDKHDKFVIRSKTQIRAICIFNPALCGKELHDENGSYPLEAEAIRV